MRSSFKSIFILGILSLIFLIRPVYADLGPKPSMYFSLKYEISEDIKLEGCEQYQCEKSDCSDAALLERLGPQGTNSLERACQSVAYGYSPYQKLVLKFSDKTRESNVFKADDSLLNSDFNVIVKKDSLEIGDNGILPALTVVPSFGAFVLAFGITIFLEMVTATAFCLILKLKLKILLSVLLGNFLTLPFVWFVFPLISSIIPWLLILVISEVFAVIVETFVIFLLNRKRITFIKSLILGILMNALSLVVGGYVLQLLTKV